MGVFQFYHCFYSYQPEWFKKELVVCVCTHVCVLSQVRLSATPWTVAHQPPVSVGCSRREYWRGGPVPSPSLRTTPKSQIVSLSVIGLAEHLMAFCVFWEQEVIIVGPPFSPLVLNGAMQCLGHHCLQTPLLYQEDPVSGSWVHWVLCILWGGRGWWFSWWCDLSYQLFLLTSLARPEG